MSVASTAARMVDLYGREMTLTRASEGTTITLKGKRIGGALAPLGNGDQQRFRVKISIAEIAASAWATKVPSAGGTAAGDTLTIGTHVYNVLDVKPLHDGETLALYELEVAG